MKVRVRFEPRDLWVGVFVAGESPTVRPGDFVAGGVVPVAWVRRVFVCIIPCLPIVFEWTVRVDP